MARVFSTFAGFMFFVLETSAAPPTFHEDILPIFQRSCQTCHRPDSVAPMSLTTYKEVRPWAKSILLKVLDRSMPPFGAEAPKGFYLYDTRLSQEEIDLIVEWIGNKCPQGKFGVKTKEPDLPKSQWDLGEPDIVTHILKNVNLTNDNANVWRFVFFDYVFERDTWIEAVQVLPDAGSAIHHLNTFYMDPGFQVPEELEILGNAHPKQSNGLSLWTAGRPPLRCPDETAMLIPAGARIGANVHFAPTADSSEEGLSIAIYLKNGTVNSRFRRYAINAPYDTIRIPPGESEHTVTRTMVLSRKDLLVHDFTGHMHYRGKSLHVEFETPTGEKSVPFSIPRFDFYWQQTYELSKSLLVQGGTKATMTGVFDNSSSNDANPDSGRWVEGGVRSVDEMLQVYLNCTDPAEHLGLTVKNGLVIEQ